MVSISGVFNPLAQRRPRHPGPSPEPSQQTLQTRSDLLRSCQSWQTQPPDHRWVQPTVDIIDKFKCICLSFTCITYYLLQGGLHLLGGELLLVHPPVVPTVQPGEH